MRLMRGAAAAAVLSGVVLSVAPASPAGADPKGEVVHVVCDDGSTYDVAVAGNGRWTPGHDTGSSTMLIPVAFGETHIQIFDDEGALVDEFVDPAATKHASAATAGTLTCTFTETEVSDGSDPELPAGFTVVVSGTVTGFTTPRGR